MGSRVYVLDDGDADDDDDGWNVDVKKSNKTKKNNRQNYMLHVASHS